MRRAKLGPVLAAIALLAGCGAAGASFDPTAPCTADGRMAGAYPELEAKVPGLLQGAPPGARDSGRSCTDKRLATLKAHGVSELRFAGATWSPEDSTQTVISVFTTPPDAPPLEAAWMEEFYQAGTEATSKTENIHVTRPNMPSVGTVWRIDTLNELSFQSVVVWPGHGVIHVVIVATPVRPGGPTHADHDRSVEIAVRQAVVPEPGLTTPPAS